MLRKFFAGAAGMVSQLAHQPIQVLSICLVAVFIGLVLDGTLFRLWSLHRDLDQLTNKTQITHQEAETLEMQILQAKDTDFIGLQARERFELAGEGDLIFVFADDE